MERMVLIIAEMGEVWLRPWMRLRNRVFSEVVGGGENSHKNPVS
jgi:hypothetical protein